MSERLDRVIGNAPPDRHHLMCALVAGDPHVEGTIEYLSTVADSGADIVELIVPFSDPAYHGPVIQRACERALHEDLSWDDVRVIVSKFRQHHETPLVVSSYYNRILAYGLDRFAEMVAAVGVDAIMVADLPWEESQELRDVIEPRGVDFVPMIAPTTSIERFGMMAEQSSTFFVWTGHSGGEVTLSRQEFGESMRAFRQVADRRVIASMKVSTGEEAASVVEHSDGVLVGSALVWLVEGRDADLSDRLATFVGNLRQSLDGTGSTP